MKTERVVGARFAFLTTDRDRILSMVKSDDDR